MARVGGDVAITGTASGGAAVPSRGLEKMRCRLQDQTLDWSPSRLGAAMGNIALYRRCGTAEQRACVIALLSHHFARVEACGCQADTLGVGFGVASVLHMWGCEGTLLSIGGCSCRWSSALLDLQGPHAAFAWLPWLAEGASPLWQPPIIHSPIHPFTFTDGQSQSAQNQLHPPQPCISVWTWAGGRRARPPS